MPGRPSLVVGLAASPSSYLTTGALPLIEISRSLIRLVRSMFRRGGIGKSSVLQQHVQLTAGADRLCLRGLTHDVALEYSQPVIGTFTCPETDQPEGLEIEAESSPSSCVLLRDLKASAASPMLG